MHSDSKVLELIQAAINEGRIEDARTLLRPLMERNLVDAYFYASRVAYTQEQALEFLRYALLLEPSNESVKQQLAELEQVYASHQLAIVPNQVVEEKPQADSANRIKKTSQLFKKHGWKIVSRDDEIAHLSRRRSMSAISAFLIALAFNVVGLLMVLWMLFTSEKIHVFVEADEDDILLTSSKGEQIISHPQQAIIMIEKYQGISVWRGLAFGLLGLAIGSLLFFYIGWQAQQNVTTIFDALQATLTAQAPQF